MKRYICYEYMTCPSSCCQRLILKVGLAQASLLLPNELAGRAVPQEELGDLRYLTAS